MSVQSDPLNRRVLVINDNVATHQNFRKILTRPLGSETALSASQASSFGELPAARAAFEMDSVYQGQEALERVLRALAENKPYAMVFVDMHMLSGWDSLQTIERLWQVDPKLQFALCNAHTDYPWGTLTRRLGADDRLLILKKPLNNIEIRQAASVLTRKWQMTKEAALKTSELEEVVEERLKALAEANLIVQNSPVILYRLRGEPSFPLIYISHEITRFGHERAALLASPAWANELVEPDDHAKVDEALARVLEKNAAGVAIEFRLRTGDGACRWVENRYVPVRDKDGRLIEVEGVIIDITERKAAEEKIARLARTDALTGLANRARFLAQMRQAFAAAQHGTMPFAILLVDLDHLKLVNDRLGYPIGDLLLREVAARLRNCTRESDLVARFGGDAFAVLQGEMAEPAYAGILAAKLQTALAAPYLLNGNDVRLSASIGIRAYVQGDSGADAMLTQAELALHRAKQTGGNRHHFHSDELDQAILERLALADDLRGAIERGEVELQYQPEVELSSGNILGMEGLVRWHHPARGLISPGVFIPIAERDGTMAALGHWVLDQACQQMRAWRDEGVAPLMIAINLSLFELRNAEAFVRDVTETAAKWRLAPAVLEFDVTEATLARLSWAHSDILPQLHALGAKIAIDDFGSEYASFEYVKDYRVNHLKIAQSLIRRSTNDPECAATIRAIVKFAHSIGIGVIAQGVETEQQRALLASTNRATSAQGFRFSEAVGAARASELLRRGHIAPCAGPIAEE
ncbi:putative bifunctional diguanylate cyclase/phosphodiesterase [Paraburkholderia phenazinium]|uniref:putative bifunctional diguanylate cyclase/phosphodiesterase n=1 Tax=Paraburkholderia phenazinium TaxID=60549 RepID=UPI001FC895D7|nr:EAL domain-containing protein [Paraburkholderia phenazinium]